MKLGSLSRWLVRAVGVAVLVLIGVLVWGYFQPKPPGFAPTDADGGAVVTEDWTRFTVDASSRDEWVFFDFNLGQTVETTFESAEWDLAFKRTDLVTNSGATNPSGRSGALDLGVVELVSAQVPSSVEFVVDRLDDDELVNPEISHWYDYSMLTHTVHPRDNTYLVRTGGADDALVQFDSYYCEDEDAACITFRYRLVPAVGVP